MEHLLTGVSILICISSRSWCLSIDNNNTDVKKTMQEQGDGLHELHETENLTENITEKMSAVPLDPYEHYEGDLVGWRRVNITEFPFVVSIRHAQFGIHICTGILITSRAVLSTIRCVVRRKVVAGRVSDRLINPKALVVVGGVNITDLQEHVFKSQVESIVTPFENAFRGELMILTIGTVPRSKFHRPIKLFSANRTRYKAGLVKRIRRIFCEVVTWQDTIICNNSTMLVPKFLKSFQVQLLNPVICRKQRRRMGIRSVGEWSADGDVTLAQCFTGIGGQHCGSAPGAPLICGKTVYGLLSFGTACSEFGDYSYFSSMNATELTLLYNRINPVTTGISSSREKALWLITIQIVLAIKFANR